MTKRCINSKRPPPTPKNAVTTTKELTKRPNFVFIKNSPILPQNKQYQICIYPKLPSPTSKNAVTPTKESIK